MIKQSETDYEEFWDWIVACATAEIPSEILEDITFEKTSERRYMYVPVEDLPKANFKELT